MLCSTRARCLLENDQYCPVSFSAGAPTTAMVTPHNASSAILARSFIITCVRCGDACKQAYHRSLDLPRYVSTSRLFKEAMFGTRIHSFRVVRSGRDGSHLPHILIRKLSTIRPTRAGPGELSWSCIDSLWGLFTYLHEDVVMGISQRELLTTHAVQWCALSALSSSCARPGRAEGQSNAFLGRWLWLAAALHP